MRKYLLLLLKLLVWIAIAIISASIYGIVNDQISATISHEYFSVFKRNQFALPLQHYGLFTAPMRIQAVFIGVISTWWYGLFLGIMLGINCMIGHSKPLPTIPYLRLIARVIITAFCTSVLFGVLAYVFEPTKPDATHLTFLNGIKNTRPAFAVAWWHNGAYIGAFVATILASFRAHKLRKDL